MSSCSATTYTLPNGVTQQAVLAYAQNELNQYGGQLTQGPNNSGSFSIPHPEVAGTYAFSSQSLTVTITAEPLLLPCVLISAAIKAALNSLASAQVAATSRAAVSQTIADAAKGECPQCATTQRGIALGLQLATIAAQNKDAVSTGPYAAFANAGVPKAALDSFLASPSTSAAAPSGATSSGMAISAHWWGFSLSLNESLTQLVISGAESGAALATVISGLQPELAPVAAIIGGGIALEGGVIKAMDQGNGVQFDLNWLELTNPMVLPFALIPLPN